MQKEHTIELLKHIYSVWGKDPLPEEIRGEVESEVGLLVFQGVVALSSTQLHPDEQKTLEALFDKNAPMHEIVSFLETHVQGFPKLVKKVGDIVMKTLTEEN